MRALITQAAESTKIAAATATTTTATGLGTVLNMIPDDIGKLATLVGIVLSCVLIFTHIRKGRVEYQKARLELELLQKRQETESYISDKSSK